MRRYEIGDEVVPGIKIVSRLGAGGYGTVYKVVAPGGVENAIKIINLQGTQGLKEFNALRLIKRISSPYLVPIHSYWIRDGQGRFINFSSDESLCVEHQALELIIQMGLGRMSLHDYMEQYRRAGKPGIPQPELLDLMTDTAKAIDYLNEEHDLGGPKKVAIQHGDIKPGNILLVGNGAQVCDYGLAKVISQGPRTSIALFSPAYCSPEANNNRPSNWSDQFSLAISYYELRTGRFPFNEEEFINAGIVASLGKLDFSLVPPAEQEVLRQATNTIPEKRFPKCMDFVNALRMSTSTLRESGPKPRSLAETLVPNSEIAAGYRLTQRLGQNDAEEFWKANNSAGKPNLIYVLRKTHGTIPDHFLQALESLRAMDEHENLVNLRECWMLHADGRSFPYVKADCLENQVVAVVGVLDNVECTLEDYHQKCLDRGYKQGIPDHELLAFMSQTAKAVDFLAEAGYQDYLNLSPWNVFLTKTKSVKISSGGLLTKLLKFTKVADSEVPQHAFMPPELLETAGLVHHNSNQYSLAMTYCWLRGDEKLPFPIDSSPIEIRVYHLNHQLDFSAIPENEIVVLREATAFDPAQRYPSCVAFIETLIFQTGSSIPKLEMPTPDMPPRPGQPTPSSTGRISTSTPWVTPGGPRLTPAPPPTQDIPIGVSTATITRPESLEKVQTTRDSQSGRDTPTSTPVDTAGPRSGGRRTGEMRGTINPGDLTPVSMLGGTMEAPPEPEAPERSEEPEDEPASFLDWQRKKKRNRKRTLAAVIGSIIVVAAIVGVVLFPWPNPLKEYEAKVKVEDYQSALPILSRLPEDIVAAKRTELTDLIQKKVVSQVAEHTKTQKYPHAEGVLRNYDWAHSLVPKEWFDGQRKLIRAQWKKALTGVKDLARLDEYLLVFADDAEMREQRRVAGIVVNRNARQEWQALCNDVPALDRAGLPAFLTRAKNLESLMTSDSSVSAERPVYQALVTTLQGLQDLKIAESASATDLASTWTTLANTGNIITDRDVAAKLNTSKLVEELRGAVVTGAKRLAKDTPYSANRKDLFGLLTTLKSVRTEGWITPAWIEAAATQSGVARETLGKVVKDFKSFDLYGHYARAVGLHATDAKAQVEAIKDSLTKAYTPGSNDELVAMPFRQQHAISIFSDLLKHTRSPEYPFGVFPKEKLSFASEVLALQSRLYQGLPSNASEDANRTKAEVEFVKLVLETADSEKLVTVINKFKGTELFGKLPENDRAGVEKYLTVAMESSKPTPAALLKKKRELLEQYYATNTTVRREELTEKLVTPLLKQIQDDPAYANALDKTQKRDYVALLGELAEEVLLNEDTWVNHLEVTTGPVDVAMRLLEEGQRVDPDFHRNAVRSAFLNYKKKGDAAFATWRRIADTAIQAEAGYFGGHLLRGVADLVAICHKRIDHATAPDIAQELREVDKHFQEAEARLTKDVRFAQQYRFILLLERSNVALRLANCETDSAKRLAAFKEAEGYLNAAVRIRKNSPETNFAEGMILEDKAMLLGNTGFYVEAITSFNNSTKLVGTPIYYKSLLHRGRSNFRYGLAAPSPPHLRNAIADFDTFLKSKDQTPANQIEAYYFRAFAQFQIALNYDRDALDRADFAQMKPWFTKCFEDLQMAKVLSNEASQGSWLRTIYLTTIDCYVAYLASITKSFKDNYPAYVADADYQRAIREVRQFVQDAQVARELASFVEARIAMHDIENGDAALKAALGNYGKSVAEAEKTQNYDVLKRSLQGRSELLGTPQANRHEESMKDLLKLYEASKKWGGESPAQSFEYLKSAINVACHQLNNNSLEQTKRDAFWNSAFDNLLDMAGNHAEQLVEKTKNTNDFIRQCDHVRTSAPANQADKMKAIVERLELSGKNVMESNRSRYDNLLKRLRTELTPK